MTGSLVMTKEDVRNAIRVFASRAVEINRDGELSGAGKEKRLAALKTQREEFKPVAERALVREYEKIYARHEAADAARAAAEELAARAWDYERLNYSARRAESAIKNAQSLDEVRKLYESAAAGGDKHYHRAMVEAGLVAVQSRFAASGELGLGSLLARMKRDAAELLQTKELEDVQNISAGIAGDAMELRAVAQEVSQFYTTVGLFSWFGGVLDRVIEAVNVTTTYEAENGRFLHSVELRPLEPIAQG